MRELRPLLRVSLGHNYREAGADSKAAAAVLCDKCFEGCEQHGHLIACTHQR